MATTLNPLLIPGSVVQRVSVTSSAVVTTSVIGGIPLASSQGVEIFNVSITPKSAASILLIRFTAIMSNATGSTDSLSGIFIDSASTAISTVWSPTTVAAGGTVSVNHNYVQLVAGSTAAKIVRVRFAPSAGSAYINADYSGGSTGGMPAMLEVLEIAA